MKEKDQQGAGFDFPTPSALGIPRLKPSDIKSTESMHALFGRLVIRRILPNTDQAWVWLVSIVEGACSRSRNPVRMVAWGLRNPDKVQVTIADEEASGARLRAWKVGGPLVPPPKAGGPQIGSQGARGMGPNPTRIGDMLDGENLQDVLTIGGRREG